MAKKLKKIIEKIEKVEAVKKAEPVAEEIIVVPKIEKEYVGGKLVIGKKTISINGKEVTELSLEDGTTTI